MVEPQTLKSLPYFADLSDDELSRLTPFVFEKRLAAGEVLFLEGEPAEAIYFVISGSVRVGKLSPEGQEQVLRIMRRGNSFNDVPIFDGGPNPATATAAEPTVVYGISGENMRRVLELFPGVAYRMLQVFASRLRHLVSLVEDLSFRSVTERIVRILLDNQEEGEVKLTQRELASLAGTAREVVNRSLRTLENMGAIQVERRHIIIRNPDFLRSLGSGDSEG